MDNALRKACAAGMSFGGAFIAALLPTLSVEERARLREAVALGAALSIEVVAGSEFVVRVALTDANGERRIPWSATVDFGSPQ
jgi:cell division inhibitor SulA